MSDKTLVILPAFNEEQAIGLTIDEIRQCFPEGTIVVADSCSTDRTAQVAKDRGVAVIPAPRGKGAAVRHALIMLKKSSLTDGHRYYVTMDSDYTYPAKHIPEFLTTLRDGADVVIGHRAQMEEAAMTRVNRIGNVLLSWLFSAVYQRWIPDICSGMWGFRREVAEKFTLTSNDFTLEADMLVNAVRNGYRIKQVPIGYRPRLEGSQSKLKVVDGVRIALFLVSRRFWFR